MKAKLFINYRRDDTRHAAGRLYDDLTTHFGKDQVFIDIDQIEPGEDFVEAINRKVGICDVAIVVIGRHWLGATDASGKRRLDDEEDFVRMEIVAALQRKIRVIPVLVDGAQMPKKHELPEALAQLSRRNAIELSETRFHADVNRLIEAIEKSFAVMEKKAELSTIPVGSRAESAADRRPESTHLPESSGSATDKDALATVGKNQQAAEAVQSRSILTPFSISPGRSAELGGRSLLRHPVTISFAAIILGVIVLFFFLAEPGKKFMSGSARSGSAPLNSETPVPQATLPTAESVPTRSTAPRTVELSVDDEHAYLGRAWDAMRKKNYNAAVAAYTVLIDNALDFRAP